ncbi:MAG: excinuclease ABC subunit UvrA [Acidobacteria bacterium]|nr:excinuclease ABC subunit UvrA [Acidobacteriota bacterium]
MTHIEIRGARTHNLKGLDVDVPKHRLVAFTGVSGSGKSSLVFDTICTEAQRQLVETFSTYARRRLPQLTRPPVDEIRNISPCIVIDQKRLGASSRSTVGTVTEIYTYLRMLFSRCGRPFIGWSHRFSFNHPDGMCPACKGLGKRVRIDVDRLLDPERSIEEGAIRHPSFDIGKWYWREIVQTRVVPPDKPLREFTAAERERLLWADGLRVEKVHQGMTYERPFDGVARKLERLHVDKNEDQIPRTSREAYRRLFRERPCSDCGGARLNGAALAVELAGGRTIGRLVECELTELDRVLAELVERDDHEPIRDVVATLVARMRKTLRHLIDIGVGYLSLNRGVPTLSGGESQRVKMARQLDCDLVDLVYILDEPTVGLHPRDIDHLIAMLRRLRDQGNSVLVVEHDPAVIRAADWVVDIGPRAGDGGGELVFSGRLEDLPSAGGATSCALQERTAAPRRERRPFRETLRIENASANNLRDVTVRIPKGVLTCFTGVAGSGKSSLVSELVETLRRSRGADPEPRDGERRGDGGRQGDAGRQGRDGVVVVDQRPVGRSSRSNPATYIGVFDPIRKLFAGANGVSPAMFSFNAQGSCPECKGRGYLEVELSFLDDVRLECKVCEGKRYREEVLELKYRGRSIHDVLEMTVAEALAFFAAASDDRRGHGAAIARGLQLLADVGVGYLRLGQPVSTLSGGEAQRLKLATELTRSGNVYVMDEPTTGLHPADIDRLLAIVDRLLAGGNTVVVIEHNLDVIVAADWIVDLGPEGGRHGGAIVAEGTPEDVAARAATSHTGRYLQERLGL